MRKSKKRMEMGEEEWAEYQKERNRRKAKAHYHSETGQLKYYTHSYAWRITAKQRLMEYKGGKCFRCGYDKPVPGAFDFHHRDPSKKEFTIGSYQILNFDKLKSEADKCDMLCRNCHAEVHDDEFKQRRKLVIDRYEERIKIQASPARKVACSQCGKEFETKLGSRKYCSNACVGLSQRKATRPSAQVLKGMLESFPREQIGKRFGVTGNAVKKWSKQYGLM